MAAVKWIKIVTDIFDDEKIKLIESMPEADAIIVIWFKLLCLAGRTNTNGVLMFTDRIPYTDEMLTAIFRRKDAIVKLALSTFESFGMIEVVNGAYTIPNWEKHQNSDKLTEIREYNRLAKARSREKQKQLADVKDKSMTSQPCQDTDIEVDTDTDTDTDKRVREPLKRFVAPTVNEVREYCRERGNKVDAERFVDYYAANGWKVGKNPMRDWKAAVRTWEKNGFDRPGAEQKDDHPASYDIAAAMERAKTTVPKLKKKQKGSDQ